MTREIYGLTHDNGDGSTSIHWFKSKEIVYEILQGNEADYLYEAYYGNEGWPAVTLTLPSQLDLVACGFRFSDADF